MKDLLLAVCHTADSAADAVQLVVMERKRRENVDFTRGMWDILNVECWLFDCLACLAMLQKSSGQKLSWASNVSTFFEIFFLMMVKLKFDALFFFHLNILSQLVLCFPLLLCFLFCSRQKRFVCWSFEKKICTHFNFMWWSNKKLFVKQMYTHIWAVSQIFK